MPCTSAPIILTINSNQLLTIVLFVYQPYPQQQHYPTSAQPSFQPPPPISPPSSSPFAFAPPPLGTTLPPGGTSRPPLVSHHSDPPPVAQPISYSFMKQQQQLPPPAPHHGSYPYVTSIPMSYRSYSGDSDRNSPQSLNGRAPAPSNPSTHSASISAQSSPLPSNFQYQRQMLPGPYEAPVGQTLPDLNRSATYPQGYYNPGYASALSTEMPRSLSYPSGYSQPYSYIPPLPSPTLFTRPFLAVHRLRDIILLVRGLRTRLAAGNLFKIDRSNVMNVCRAL